MNCTGGGKGSYMICPQPTMSTQLRISWKKWRTDIQILELYIISNEAQWFSNMEFDKPYIFNQHGTLITPPIPVSQGRYKTPWVHFEQRLGFLVRIHLDILIWNAFKFQCYPHALYKGTENISRVISYARPVGKTPVVTIATHQKQLPYNFKSISPEWLAAVVAAKPVGCLW